MKIIADLIYRIIAETVYLFLEISPYLIIGFFFAGLLHTFIGETTIRKHFARSGLLSTIKATILGIPLPICSCGVIPLAESLRKDGASKSSVMAFLVSTPSSGVDSIFATYALMGPVFAIFRPIASLISGVVVGIATHFSDRKEPVMEPPAGEAGGKKSFRTVFDYGFKVLPSEIYKWLLLGVVIGGIISALIPPDFASEYLTTPFLHYFVILVISVPLYVCATGSIPIAASLLMKGIMPGAVLAFLIAGPATNTVTMSFVYKKLGKKVAVIYLLAIILTSILLGMVFDLVTGELNIIHAMQHSHSAGGTDIIKIISAVLLALIFINGRFDLAGKMKRSGGGGMETVKVKDITCNHCRMTLMNALSTVKGIGNLEILVDRKEVHYDGDAGIEQVRDKIREAGYNPE